MPFALIEARFGLEKMGRAHRSLIGSLLADTLVRSSTSSLASAARIAGTFELTPSASMIRALWLRSGTRTDGSGMSGPFWG